MASENYLERMKKIVAQGGRLALDLIDHSEPALKPDNSVISKTDKAISILAHDQLQDLLQTEHHILIDEEDPNRIKYLDQELLDRTPFVWTVDPIDGTRSYVNQIPNFGISIGLLKNLRPWMGMVYFPLLNELFYCDGENSFFITEAFTDKEKVTPITPVDQVISNQSIFLCHDAVFRDFQWDYKDCHVMIQSCAVVDMCWPSIGRGCGAIVKSSIWDFGGGWPIAMSAGLALRNLKTGHVLDRLQVELLDREKSPWKMKDYYILSSARNFPILKNKLKSIRPL